MSVITPVPAPGAAAPHAEHRAETRQPLSWRAGLLAFFLSSLWGGNAIAIKAGLRDAPPLRLGWMRFVLGGLVVLVWVIVTRQSLRVARHEWMPLLGLGLLFSVQLAFMNIGQDYTSAGHAVVVTTTFPLWSAVFAHLFVRGDRLSRERVIGILIAYGGVVAVFARNLSGDPGDFLLGDSLLLCSAILLGARQVYLSQIAQGIPQAKLLIAQSVFGTASFVIASLVVESDPYRFTWVLALALAYQGIIIAGFGFIGQTWLLKHYFPSRVTVISLSQPIIGVVLSWAILGESVGGELYIGAGLVVVGSYLAQRHR